MQASPQTCGLVKVICGSPNLIGGSVRARAQWSYASKPDFLPQRKTDRKTEAMTSAYGGTPGTGTQGLDNIECLPLLAALSTGRKVEVAAITPSEWPEMMALMNEIIEEGLAWPFNVRYETLDAYRGYFLSHAGFVVRALEPGTDTDGKTSKKGDVIGCVSWPHPRAPSPSSPKMCFQSAADPLI